MGQKFRLEVQVVPEFQNWVVWNADVLIHLQNKAQLCIVILLELQISWLH